MTDAPKDRDVLEGLASAIVLEGFRQGFHRASLKDGIGYAPAALSIPASVVALAYEAMGVYVDDTEEEAIRRHPDFRVPCTLCGSGVKPPLARHAQGDRACTPQWGTVRGGKRLDVLFERCERRGEAKMTLRPRGSKHSVRCVFTAQHEGDCSPGNGYEDPSWIN